MIIHKSPAASSAWLSLAAAVALSLPAPAQSWSDEFDLSGVAGRVFSTTAYQGDLVIGGYRSLQADNQNFGLVARFDGTSWNALGSGIVGGGASIDHDVRDFALYQGELVAAGTFTFAGVQPALSIARFDGVDWQPLGAGLDLSFAFTGSVFSLAVYQGDLYASGEFNLAGGAPVQGLARWDGSQWHDVGGGFPPLGGSTPGFAWKMAVGPDDLLYLVGQFPSAGGTPGTKDIATWDGQSWGTVGGGFTGGGGGGVRDLAWYQGELWAVGAYDLAPGGANAEKAAIWNGSAWRAAGNFPDTSIGTRIEAIAVYGADVYLGGNIASVDGVSLRRLARFDGSVWSSPGGVFANSINQFVIDLTVLNGTLWVGGEFSSVGYLAPGNAVVVSNSIGAFDGTQWSAVGKGLGVNGAVRSSTVWNGKTVAIGSFNQAGDALVGGVALFDGTSWESLGTFTGGAAGATVFQGDLVVVGGFSSVNGVSTPAPAARFDGTQWQALGTGALANAVTAAVFEGQLYAAADFGLWRLDGTQWNQVGMQVFGTPYALQAHAGRLYLGGSYSFGQGNVFEWDGASLTVLGGGTNDAVRALCSFGEDLIVGGEFSTAGGSPTQRLARWDGKTWSGIGSLTGTDVTALGVLRGELYVGGNLFAPGFPANKYIARSVGGNLEALQSGMFGQPLTFAADEARGLLHVGGIFLGAGGSIAHNFSTWDTGLGGLAANFCTAGTSANGCSALLSSAGAPSATATSGFTLTATAVEGAKDGLYFFGANGRQASSWGSGTSFQCVVPPVTRARLLQGSGTSGTCDGVFSEDLNALWCPTCPSPQKNPGPGAVVQAQLWYRDPLNTSNRTTSLSDAVEFTVTP